MFKCFLNFIVGQLKNYSLKTIFYMLQYFLNFVSEQPKNYFFYVKIYFEILKFVLKNLPFPNYFIEQTIFYVLNNVFNFQEWIFLALILKKFLYSLKSFSYISGNGTPAHFSLSSRNKRIHPEKIFYTLVNGNPEKSSLYIRKRNFLIFQERNIQDPVITELSYISR